MAKHFSTNLKLNQLKLAGDGNATTVYVMFGIRLCAACVAETFVPSGKCCRVGVRMRFDNIYVRRGNGVRNLKQKSVFQRFTILDAKIQ